MNPRRRHTQLIQIPYSLMQAFFARLTRLLPLLLSLIGVAPNAVAALNPATLAKLADPGFTVKAEAIAELANSGDPAASAILNALLEGLLFIRKEDQQLVIAAAAADPLITRELTASAPLPARPKSDFKKIAINNTLRGAIRLALARLGLASADAAQRIRAATALTENPDEATQSLLKNALARETDAGVRERLNTALALGELSAPSPDAQLAAIAGLRNSLLAEVRNRLGQLGAEDNTAVDPRVRRAAAAAARDIDRKRATYQKLETVFFGLSLGFVLVLAAAGLAITFGVMGVINMAHGELMMVGAYTTYVVQLLMPAQLEYSMAVAIPAAFVVAALIGIAIERGVVRFLYGRPLETLLATFGISLLLQQLARSLFSPLNRNVQSPLWMSGQWAVNDALSLTMNRVYIIAFSLCVFIGLQALLRYTALGLQIRAVAQNRAMARALGVRSGLVDALTFGLGSGVAGLAGVALSQLTNVGPNLGQAYIIDSFMVVVFGGVGNLWGTLVAGLSLGVANKFLEPFVGAVLAKILVLVFIILFIQRRPRGLFPQRGRSADV
jgi:urea transport system permease protein